MAEKAPRKRNACNEETILVKSRRRCCICFGLNHDVTEKKGQIAHLDRDPSNDSLDNLAWLCLDHHDEYDSRTSQSKSLQMGEVKQYRKELYECLAGSQSQAYEPKGPKVQRDPKTTQFRTYRINVSLSDPPHTCGCCGYSFLITPELEEDRCTCVTQATCPKCGSRERVMRFYDGQT